MLPAPNVTILDGNRFLVADSHGDVAAGSVRVGRDRLRGRPGRTA